VVEKGAKYVIPRKLRIEYPVAIYHVMSRGDRREDIFVDDVDRQMTLSLQTPYTQGSQPR